MRRTRIGFLCLGVSVVLGLHLWSLLRYPAPYVDEGWLVSRAWSFLQTGRQFGALDVGIFDRVDGAWHAIGLVPTLVAASGLVGAEAPNLLGPRLVSLTCGAALLYALYVISSRLADPRMGLLAVLLTSLSAPFFYSAHLARPDIYAAAFGYGALAVYLALPGRFWAGVASGLLLSLAVENHPHSVIFGPAMLALLLQDHGLRAFRKPCFLGTLAGGIGGMALYAAVHVLPSPEGYFAFNNLAFSSTHTPPLLTRDPALLYEAFDTFLFTTRRAYVNVGIFYVAAFALLFVWRSPAGSRLRAYTLPLLLAFILLVRHKQEFYTIYYSPVLDLAVAYALVRLWDWRFRGRLAGALARGAIGGLLLVSLARNLPPIEHDLYGDYLDAQRQINAVVRPGESVMGRQQYWFGLTENTFYTWEGLVYYRRLHPSSSMAETLAERRPDILIIDSGLGKYLHDKPKTGNVNMDHLRLPGQETRTFLLQNADLLTLFEGLYGPTFVYRIRWAEISTPAPGSADSNASDGSATAPTDDVLRPNGRGLTEAVLGPPPAANCLAAEDLPWVCRSNTGILLVC